MNRQDMAEFRFPDLTVWVHVGRGEVLIEGPSPSAWYDEAAALRTARLFLEVRPEISPAAAFAAAVHGQYAAWKGACELAARSWRAR